MTLVIDERIKHRLIGLAVIISLGAIFAPAIMKNPVSIWMGLREYPSSCPQNQPCLRFLHPTKKPCSNQ